MTSVPLSSTVRQLADFLDIRGGANDAAEWRRIADILDGLSPDEASSLPALARRNRLADLSALPPATHARLSRLIAEGPEVAAAKARSALPSLHKRLLDFAAVDPASAASLARGGIVTAQDLEAALEDGRIRDGDLRARLARALETVRAERPAVTLGRAADVLHLVAGLLEDACRTVQDVTIAGDTRRVEPLVEALAIACHAPDPAAAIDRAALIPSLRVLHRSGRRLLAAFQQWEVDIRVAAADEYGTALYTATGPPAHLAAMRARQRTVRLCAREADVYAHAGLPWIPPELRGDGSEVAEAAAGLPPLLAREDVRGDLHLHSTYSDGRDALADMVRACAALGYEYIAVTDHSERSAASRTLSIESLARQSDEIERLRPQYPQMTILHGVEVDIMPDGRLDFPDEVLERLDIVLASLHDSSGHDARRLTERCLAAIDHPLVNVITHPSNRLVGRDEGYELDFDRVYRAAVRSGTALEIDGAPSHLDLDGRRAREAAAAGVTLTVDSDGHKAALLDRQMRFGVGMARKGRIEPRHVLNTRPVSDVTAFVAAKRRRRA